MSERPASSKRGSELPAGEKADRLIPDGAGSETSPPTVDRNNSAGNQKTDFFIRETTLACDDLEPEVTPNKIEQANSKKIEFLA